MAQTVANITKVLKEVWTADNLERQFYDKYPIFDRLTKTNKYTIGKEAEVPLHTGRSGNTTILGAAGGSMNAADAQKVDRGTFGLGYNYGPIKIELGAINQASGGNTSVVDALNLEVTGATNDLRKDITAQWLGNGDALYAQCTTTSGATTVNLLGTGYGSEAIVRGFLRPGQTVDISTSANPDVAVTNGTGRVIQSVTSGASPSIVLDAGGGNVTTSTSHYVKITGARTGTAGINVSAGFRNMFGSATAVVGGLDPSSSAYWAPAYVDTTTTTLTLDVPLTIQQNVFQQTGEMPGYVLTGIKQLTNLYTLLQNQVRFAGDRTQAGNVQAVQWAGMQIEAIPDASDREWYMYDPETILIITGQYTSPQWITEIEGLNRGLHWTPGQTNFQDALAYPCGLAIRRRNAAGAAVALTA